MRSRIWRRSLIWWNHYDSWTNVLTPSSVVLKSKKVKDRIISTQLFTSHNVMETSLQCLKSCYEGLFSIVPENNRKPMVFWHFQGVKKRELRKIFWSIAKRHGNLNQTFSVEITWESQYKLTKLILQKSEDFIANT